MIKVLLIVSGSISAYKSPSIANALSSLNCEVKIILTKNALKFITKLSFASQGFETFVDEDEWNISSVLHIDLQKWADRILIAPCSANMLAKIANGFADNLASNVLRAQNSKKSLYIAPAMNTEMYNNSLTKEHLQKLNLHFSNFKEIKPQSKRLACGDEGLGALANIQEIAKIVSE